MKKMNEAIQHNTVECPNCGAWVNDSECPYCHTDVEAIWIGPDILHALLRDNRYIYSNPYGNEYNIFMGYKVIIGREGVIVTNNKFIHEVITNLIEKYITVQKIFE